MAIASGASATRSAETIRPEVGFNSPNPTRAAPEPSTADAANARISLVAIDRRRSGFVEVPLTVERRGFDFDLAATIDVKALMRSTPDLRSARLQLRLDWENGHWNTLVSSAHTLTVPGVKQHPGGLLALRRVRTPRAAPPTPRQAIPTEATGLSCAVPSSRTVPRTRQTISTEPKNCASE